MEQAVLTPGQKQVLALVSAEPRMEDFYLTGGTALAAYYFHHRISDDLDFFTPAEPDTQFLHEFAERIKTELNAQNVRFERLHDRNMFFFSLPDGELKLEFTRYPFNQLEKPASRDGIRVDSLRDIAANKLMALLDRFDPKDFVDLYVILQQRTLADTRNDAKTKFGHAIGDILLGSELAKVRRIETLPRMIAPLALDELKTFFAKRAKELSENVLAS